MNSSDPNPMTSPSLLLRIRNPEDQQSWENFERIYGRIVRGYCFKRRLQDSDVEDIVQEVMTSVSKAIRGFEYQPSKGRFRGWLGTITANKINDHFNKRTRRGEALVPLGSEEAGFNSEFADPDNEWVEVFSERVYEEAVLIARPAFEDKTWRCFELTWIESLPVAEVAAQLEIPVHSVYVNKSRVLKRLEQEVKNLADDLAFDFSVDKEE